MLLPLIGGLNEMVSGPCRENIKIVLETPNLYVFPIFTRLINDLNHQFYILKVCVLQFMLSLCESQNPEVIKTIAKHVSVTALEEIIKRICKKIYLCEKIKRGELDKPQNCDIKDCLIGLMQIEWAEKRENRNQKPAMKDKKTCNPTQSKFSQMPEEDLKINPNWIPLKLEEYFDIEHWRDLLDLYLTSSDFSDRCLFKIVFNSIILWDILSKYSRLHSNRLREIKLSAKLYYKPKVDADSEGGTMKQKSKPGILAIFFF